MNILYEYLFQWKTLALLTRVDQTQNVEMLWEWQPALVSLVMEALHPDAVSHILQFSFIFK